MENTNWSMYHTGCRCERCYMGAHLFIACEPVRVSPGDAEYHPTARFSTEKVFCSIRLKYPYSTLKSAQRAIEREVDKWVLLVGISQ